MVLLKAKELQSILGELLLSWPTVLHLVISDYLVLTREDHFHRLFNVSHLTEFGGLCIELNWKETLLPVDIRHWSSSNGRGKGIRQYELYNGYGKTSVLELERVLAQRPDHEIYLTSFFIGSPLSCADYIGLAESLKNESEIEKWIQVEIIAEDVLFRTKAWFTVVDTYEWDFHDCVPFVQVKLIFDESWFKNRTEVDVHGWMY